jgi:hypothetical protein
MPWNVVERLVAFRTGYSLSADRLSHLFDAVERYLHRGLKGVRERVEVGEPAFVAYWQAGLGDRLTRASSWVRIHRSELTG